MIVAAIEAMNNPKEFSDAVNAANIVAMYNPARSTMPIIANILRILSIYVPRNSLFAL